VIDRFALIIGAMKSGTSSLFWYLSEHPEIAPCSDKEPHFFRDRNGSGGLRNYEALWDWHPERHRWALEASTSYAKRPARPDVAERLAKLDRTFKFVYVMRDPVDRIESHRAHNLLSGRWRECRHIEDTLHVVETTRYAAQLDEYTEWFSEDDILLVKFEDMIEEPRETVERVFEFLDLETEVEIEGLGENRNPTSGNLRDRLASRVLKDLGVVDEPGIEDLPGPIRGGYRRLLQQEIPSPELTDEELDWVEFSLAADVARLEEEYGFDTSGWSICA
jgi:hypothetical protein